MVTKQRGYSRQAINTLSWGINATLLPVSTVKKTQALVANLQDLLCVLVVLQGGYTLQQRE